MEELKVKVGDNLLLRITGWNNTEKIVHVVKVTPTGRIRISGFSDLQFDKYGNKIGRDCFSTTRYTLKIPNEEDYKRVREQNTINEAYNLLKNIKLEDIDYDTACHLIELIKYKQKL